MANTNNLTATGLYTFQNFLSQIPAGALIRADNVNIDRDGVIEPSRGFTQYTTIGTANSRAKQLLDYKTRLLVHYDSTISYDNGSGTMTSLTDSYTETSTGLRMKFIELNSNLYLTTNQGIKKVATTSASPFTTIEEDVAGGVKASDLEATPDYSSVGFLTEYSKVAYRVIWLRRDINDNLIIGYPSARFEVTNAADKSCQVSLDITIPNDVTSDYFFQVYRSSVAQITLPSATPLSDLSAISSDDELRLVYEAYPTPGELSAGELTVVDIVPSDYRDGGANLYTNEASGDGLAQANFRPPFAKDIALYKNTSFFANTKTYQSMNLALTGTGNMIELPVSSITTDFTHVTIAFASPHGLGALSNSPTNPYIVLKGVEAANPSNTLNKTAQVYDSTTTTIRIAHTGTITIDPLLNAAVYTSYLILSLGASVERYFFVGRKGKVSVDLPAATASGILDNQYFQIKTMDNKQTYYIWYEVDGAGGVDPLINGEIGIKVSVLSTDSSSQVATKTMDAILAASYDFEFSISSNTLTFITPTSGFLDDTQVSIAGGLALTNITLVQEGFGEDSTEKYARLSTYSSPSTALDDTARSLIKVINKSSALVDASYESTITDVPGKMFFEALSFNTTPFFVISNEDIFGSDFSPSIADPLSSTNEESPNRIYYSKTNEPEHVPKLNYIDVGPKDKAIVRILGLQDSLFIFKEEGIYRLTGETAANFSIRLHDSSGVITAPDSAVVLNNQIYVYTTQGIVAVSEAGMTIISRQIENLILRSATYTNFGTSTFSLASETDRALFVYTVKDNTDDVATIAYRYNIFTRAWTTNTRTAVCGVLNTGTNKFFLGADDINLIEVERKTYTRRDFANRQHDRDFLKNSKLGNTITLSSSLNVRKGDVIIQTQYLTISQFNRLLGKLDNDPDMKHPSIADYFRQEAAVSGDDLNDKIEDLVDKLNIRDSFETYTYTPTASFAAMQSSYNTNIIDKLNISDGVFYANYDSSIGTVDYEVRIDELNTGNAVVTHNTDIPIITGECVVHNYIPVDVMWAPNHFGDPSVLKHVRESTIMFEDTSFAEALYGFNTDLSGNYESITFRMNGDGVWGNDPYDTNAWGGSGLSMPFRTYIPKQKQRCRYIRSRFQTRAAFTKFAVLGLSYVFEVSSERAYR